MFNVSGFAIYIKISGMILIKNYIHNRLNLKILMNDEFNIGENILFSSVYNTQSNLANSSGVMNS